MKKFLVVVLAMMVLVLVGTAYAKTDKEILFRDTQWGISFTETKKQLPEFKLRPYGSGYAIEVIVSDNFYTKQYEFNDLGFSVIAENGKMNIAGYTTTDIELSFAYAVKDGAVIRNDTDSALYAARYIFMPADIEAVSNDLMSKLESLYGEIDYTDYDKGVFDITTWYVWHGINNTNVALTVEKATSNNWDDKIWITYYNYNGDDWLQNVSDAIKDDLIAKEREGADGSGTDGL